MTDVGVGDDIAADQLLVHHVEILPFASLYPVALASVAGLAQ